MLLIEATAGLPPPASHDPDRTLWATDSDGAPLDAESVVPEQIGRFPIRCRLGAGAMGTVYEGYDDQLGRRVAIKLLRDGGNERHQARLLREAKALARLNHANVVQVYEIGAHDGQLAVVMELVDGQPLDQWQREPTRTSEEILQAYIQAARGLQAAHEAGLVHRDFKSSNVLMGHDGRVRVVDFGLALSEADDEDDVNESAIITMLTGRVDLREYEAPVGRLNATRSGAMMGTPAYMSPEQHWGEPATSWSDQFSFCVALFEALYHQHPFVEPGAWNTLTFNVTRGRLRPIPRRRDVPTGVREALLRGMSTEPQDRWPSMERLLQALSRQRRDWPRRWLGIAVATGVALLTAGAAISVRHVHASQEQPSESTSAPLENTRTAKAVSP